MQTDVIEAGRARNLRGEIVELVARQRQVPGTHLPKGWRWPPRLPVAR